MFFLVSRWDLCKAKLDAMRVGTKEVAEVTK